MIIISKEELRELLEAYHTLQALECGGVDNWDWCGESISDYCAEANCKDIDEIVENDLKTYKEVT